MKTKKRKYLTVTEDVACSEPLTVDRDAGIIAGVKICGTNSKHGYEYSRKALEEAAQQYSQVKVYFDHPPRDNPSQKRKFSEWFGKFENVTVKEDGAYGDLHYLKSHPEANKVCEAAERMPNFGFSHVADVFTGGKPGGKVVVESVGKVRSVDLVLNPATNTTLFESEDHVKQLTVRDVLSRKKNKKFAPLLVVLEESEYDSAPVEAPEGGEMKAGSEAEMKAAFASMIQAAFEDDALDMKATIKKIREIIKAYYKLSEEPEPEDEEETDLEEETTEGDDTEVEKKDDGTETAAEDVDETVERLQAEIAARDLLEEHDIPSTPSRVKALVAMEDDDERAELLTSFPKRGKSSRPGFGEDGLPNKRPKSRTTMEDDDETIQFPEGGKAFASAVRSRPTFG